MICDLILKPVNGNFDTGKIRGYLKNVKFTSVDPISKRTILLADNAEAVNQAIKVRRHSNIGYPMSVVLIDIFPDSIEINYRIVPPKSLSIFIKWLL